MCHVDAWYVKCDARPQPVYGSLCRNAVSKRYQSDASAMRRAMSGPLLALPVSISEEGVSVKDAPGEAASENEDDDIDGHDPGDDPEVGF